MTLRSKDKVPRRSLRYVKHRLMVIQPHTKYHWPISRQKCYGPNKKILFKKPLFYIEVKGQDDTRHTALWSCTHIPNIIDLSRKKQLFDLDAKGQGPTKVITVRETPLCGHAPTYEISLTYLERQKSYGPDKLRWEAEAEEKIRLKQYVSLRLKGRHN